MFTHAVALAQAAPAPFESRTMGTPAHDVAMAGTVQELIATHTLGAPAGTQLVVEGPQGSFTASLGSALSDQVLQTLVPGTPVQVTGVMGAINGKAICWRANLPLPATRSSSATNTVSSFIHNSVLTLR
jgi:hypothetical protein